MVSRLPIGLSQLELQPPRWGGEQIVPEGFSRSIRPSAAVADLVEAIWDWDIPDGDAAMAFTIKVPPSTAPYFVVQYRTLTHCRWQLGVDSYDHKNYGHVLTQTQSGSFAIRPRGPLGVITVRLKPEAASRLARASMYELINVKIGLRNIFKDNDIALLEERVMECGSSSERIACVESFLLQNLREDREDPVFSRASSWLRRNPGLRMRQLASLLDISERRLSRGFRAIYGISLAPEPPAETVPARPRAPQLCVAGTVRFALGGQCDPRRTAVGRLEQLRCVLLLP